jgi:hypothetical protein
VLLSFLQPVELSSTLKAIREGAPSYNAFVSADDRKNYIG